MLHSPVPVEVELKEGELAPVAVREEKAAKEPESISQIPEDPKKEEEKKKKMPKKKVKPPTPSSEKPAVERADVSVQADIAAPKAKFTAQTMDAMRQRPGSSEQFFQSNHIDAHQIHWFKWDSTDVYKLDPSDGSWIQRTEVKMASKFLFFSSVCHVPEDLGCFIIGGSDNEDNYSKRTQYFCKYTIFLEKAPMINKRAFFPSVFT